MLKIILNGSDLYDATFIAIHGKKFKEVVKFTDLYYDNLVEVF